jgi:hypothetical protein
MTNQGMKHSSENIAALACDCMARIILQDSSRDKSKKKRGLNQPHHTMANSALVKL